MAAKIVGEEVAASTSAVVRQQSAGCWPPLGEACRSRQVCRVGELNTRGHVATMADLSPLLLSLMQDCFGNRKLSIRRASYSIFKRTEERKAAAHISCCWWFGRAVLIGGPKPFEKFV
jgi:hypothetical protein